MTRLQEKGRDVLSFFKEDDDLRMTLQELELEADEGEDEPHKSNDIREYWMCGN